MDTQNFHWKLSSWFNQNKRYPKSRRLCYLKTILHRDDEELVKEVYNAQKTDPTDGDFVILVDQDSKDIDLGMIEDRIINTKDDEYKSIV